MIFRRSTQRKSLWPSYQYFSCNTFIYISCLFILTKMIAVIKLLRDRVRLFFLMFYAPLLLFIAFVIAGGPIPISSSFYRYSDKYLAFNITFDQAIYVLDTISGDRLKLTSSKFRQIKIFACKQNIRKFYSISTLLHGMVNL